MNTILKVNAIYKAIISRYGVGNFTYLNVRDAIAGRKNTLSKDDQIKVLSLVKDELQKVLDFVDFSGDQMILEQYTYQTKLFNYYVVVRDAGPDGMTECCTCGNKFHWDSMHAGHFLSAKFIWTRFDERNANAQCAICNLGIDVQFKYSLFLRKKYGKNTPEELYKISLNNNKFSLDVKKFNKHYQSSILKIIKEKGLPNSKRIFLSNNLDLKLENE